MLRLVELAKFTPNLSAVTRFYEQLLHRKPDAQYNGMSEFHLDDVVLRIHKTYEIDEGDLPPEDHIAFAVDDIEAACRDAESNGLTVEIPSKLYKWGKSAYFRDPDGRLVKLHELSHKKSEPLPAKKASQVLSRGIGLRSAISCQLSVVSFQSFTVILV